MAEASKCSLRVELINRHVEYVIGFEWRCPWNASHKFLSTGGHVAFSRADRNRDLEGVADVVKPNYDTPCDEDKRRGRKRKPREAEVERCVDCWTCVQNGSRIIDASLAAVSCGLAIGSLFTNRNICSTVPSATSIRFKTPRASLSSFAERECTRYFPDSLTKRCMCIHGEIISIDGLSTMLLRNSSL